MGESKEEKMENQNKLFITSDLHWKNFYHRNIIKYCNRHYELSLEGIAKMNEDILKQFDELPEESTILNLGDILLNSSKYLSFNKELFISIIYSLFILNVLDNEIVLQHFL